MPVTQDKKLTVVLFSDAGDAPYVQAVAAATPLPTPVPPSGPHAPAVPPPPIQVTYKQIPFSIKTDFGFGIRLSTPVLPQLIRIDFATGQQGTHISFGFGQDF